MAEFNLQHNVSLETYNTLSVPAIAKSLVEIESVDQLQHAIAYAKENSMSLLVLGEGSNTVFNDDVDALVVVNRIKGKQVIEETEQDVTLKIGAGENWHKLVEWSLKNRWYGLQNLALIPGTVGAAPIQNIGAYGVELESVFIELECVEIEFAKTRVFDKELCQFAYRDSVFKNQLRDKVVITSVTLKLQKQASNNLSYPALRQYFENLNVEHPLPGQVFNVVCKIRNSKLPNPTEIPNAGSFFKNPIISEQHYQNLIKQHPDIVAFPVDGGIKLAAGWLIERAGWKGKAINGVATHHQQALVIVNPKNQTGKYILEYANSLQLAVYEIFSVKLEIEPRVYS